MGINRKMVLGWLPVGLLALTGCMDLGLSGFKAQEVVSKDFVAKATPRIVVDTFNGGIEIKVTNEATVHADVTKRAGASSQDAAQADLKNIQVIMSQEGDTIRIKASQEAGKLAIIKNRGADVLVEAPVGAILELHSSNGKVDVNGLAGDVVSDTSNGSIQVKGTRGGLRLSTSNGKITVQDGAGLLNLRTSNGAIDIHSEKGLVDAHTSNGTIHFSGKMAAGAHTLETSNGKIVVSLPADTQFNVEASTSNGSVGTDFPLSKTEYKKKNRLQGTVGDKPAISLKLHTSNGSIKVEHAK